jgi:hypothetical protein
MMHGHMNVKKILYMDTSVYRDHGKMAHEQKG